MVITESKQAFGEDFSRNLPCRLINPAKPEVGKISKAILDRVLSEIRPHLRINAWKNTTSVIDWFNNIHDKQRCSFTSFDIVDFYPMRKRSFSSQGNRYYSERTESG